MKLFVFVCLFGTVFAGHYLNYDLRRIDSIRIEPECNSAGGMCTIAADCPYQRLAERRGLCPKQQSEGIECCYGISVKETRCRKRGGECMSLANTSCNIVSKEATDCGHGGICCILV